MGLKFNFFISSWLFANTVVKKKRIVRFKKVIKKGKKFI